MERQEAYQNRSLSILIQLLPNTLKERKMSPEERKSMFEEINAPFEEIIAAF